MIQGIGVDIVQHDRVNLEMATRLFTANELEYFNSLDQDLKLEHVASRFALKEAIIKATNKEYSFLQIELFNHPDGYVQSNIKGLKISLSHEKDISIGFAILEK